jgi:hypothetical protein
MRGEIAMTDNELDEILNRWRAPMPSAGLRERVLSNTPQRLERRSYRRPLRWVLAIAAATCLLTLGMGQTGHFSLYTVADRLNNVQMKAVNFFGSLWWNHVLNAFHNSHPKIYLDGEGRSDTVLSPPAWIGEQTFAMWVRIPGEGRYFIALGLDLKAHKGPPPPVVGRFDGHVLEFQAGDRLVRIESDETFGFGAARKVYLLGIREGSQ